MADADHKGEPLALPLNDVLGLAPERDTAASEMSRLLDLSARQAAEIVRLTAALKAANDRAERFERGWYLRGDVLEKLQSWADAYPVELFPEVLRQEWQQANEVLAQAGLSMTRMSASNMRHVINGVRKLVEEGLKA